MNGKINDSNDKTVPSNDKTVKLNGKIKKLKQIQKTLIDEKVRLIKRIVKCELSNKQLFGISFNLINEAKCNNEKLVNQISFLYEQVQVLMLTASEHNLKIEGEILERRGLTNQNSLDIIRNSMEMKVISRRLEEYNRPLYDKTVEWTDRALDNVKKGILQGKQPLANVALATKQKTVQMTTRAVEVAMTNIVGKSLVNVAVATKVKTARIISGTIERVTVSMLHGKGKSLVDASVATKNKVAQMTSSAFEATMNFGNKVLNFLSDAGQGQWPGQ